MVRLGAVFKNLKPYTLVVFSILFHLYNIMAEVNSEESSFGVEEE